MSTTEKSLVNEFEEFLTRYYEEEVMELAKNYPQKTSLKIEFSDIEKFDPEISEELLKNPDKTIPAAKRALKNIDLPIDKDLEETHVRFIELPNSEKVLARDIRSHHIGNFLSMEGIIRKATEVRPKLIKAHFECVRCGTEQKVKQNGSEYKEPYECNGCDRKGPFDLNEDKSEFMDSQKLQIQEVPEELRGGEQPQDINIQIEDDITGIGVPGNRVIINGVLRSYQKTNTQGKTNIFDVFIDCNSIEVKEQEFKEIEITEREKKKIIDLSQTDDIYQKIKDSIAPTIYGYDKVKEAMALQLFSGVPKKLPDGSRIRGDIHTLLVGDPGIGKCVAPDTIIERKEEKNVEIKRFVEKLLDSPEVIEDGFYEDVAKKGIQVPTINEEGKREYKKVTKIWKRKSPDYMYKIKTGTGKELELTPSHPLFILREDQILTRRGKNLKRGDIIAASGKMKFEEIDSSSKILKSETYEKTIVWEEITEITKIEPHYKWVYDLEVRDNHNYVTNKIFSHNSQILRYVSNLAPRGVYASGKSSTSAGLCVSPNTSISTTKGNIKIRDLVEENIQNPEEIRSGVYKKEVDLDLFLFSLKNRDHVEKVELDSLWKLESPEQVIKVVTRSNKEIELTRNTALPVKNGKGSDNELKWIKSDNLSKNHYLASIDFNEGRNTSLSNIEPEWEKIKEIKSIEPDYDYVYDVTVKNHNFLANNLFVHNTAAAVRDEFGDGKWTLEAGALVLADKGIATIDEIDKMESKDRSALHEAMEQQSISIAKAGITATLQSRCALLGASNPKYGRFDEYEPIAEQIDLEPTLLSRFDLIFTIQDDPDKEKDSRVASHIMTSHETGEKAKNKNIGTEENESEDIMPEIEPDMLRKYIAFSKKVTPVLKPDSKDQLRNFYLELREAGESEESPVPVTARQLEALIRLAEASARTRLSEEITEKDADRAIKIVKSCLEEVGVDPETGELDIDVLTTGTSKSQRDKIRVVKEIIDEFDEGGDGADKEDVIEEAKNRGIDETDARDIIKKLRENGDIIEPITNNTLRTT